MAGAGRARCVFQKESAIRQGWEKSLFSSATETCDGSSTPHRRTIAWTLLYVRGDEMSTHRYNVAVAVRVVVVVVLRDES